MKKLVVIIIILVMILIGMIGYKKTLIKTSNISIEEVEKIEHYIERIYMWKEVTKEALPCFEEINQASEKWIWEVVKKNLEEYEVSYQQIQEKAKELFGEELKKELPKDGMGVFVIEEENLYGAQSVELDKKEDTFVFHKIDKTPDGYEIEIIEYLEDYSESDKITIRNLKEEEIQKVEVNTEESKIQEIVKTRMNELGRKKIVIKNEEKGFVIQSVREVR